jgi:hypothetical protein
VSADEGEFHFVGGASMMSFFFTLFLAQFAAK